MNVLLAESDPNTAALVAFALESQLGATVFESNDPQAAVDFLGSLSDGDLAIIGDLQKYKALFEQIIGSDAPQIQSIVCIEQKLSDPSLLLYPGVLGVAKRKQIVDDIMDLIRKNMVPGDVLAGVAELEFCRIRPALLLKTTPLITDVYIRLSEQKYLKVFPKDGNFEQQDYEKYVQTKKVEYLYIKRADSALFMENLTKAVDAVVADPNADPVLVQSMSVDLHNTTHHLIGLAGVTEEVAEMTKANMKLVLKSVSKNNTLSRALARFKIERNQYIPQHSLALAEVSCSFAAKIKWMSDLTFQKLILASLFHDISLKNHDLAKARSLAEVQTSPDLLLLDKFDDYKLHPVYGAELACMLRDVPADVDSIIRQHHEKPDGSGFPTGSSHNRLTPLSCLFIIAHDFVDYYEDHPHPTPETLLAGFLKKNEDQYSLGFFKKITKELTSPSDS